MDDMQNTAGPQDPPPVPPLVRFVIHYVFNSADNDRKVQLHQTRLKAAFGGPV